MVVSAALDCEVSRTRAFADMFPKDTPCASPTGPIAGFDKLIISTKVADYPWP